MCECVLFSQKNSFELAVCDHKMRTTLLFTNSEKCVQQCRLGWSPISPNNPKITIPITKLFRISFRRSMPASRTAWRISSTIRASQLSPYNRNSYRTSHPCNCQHRRNASSNARASNAPRKPAVPPTISIRLSSMAIKRRNANTST